MIEVNLNIIKMKQSNVSIKMRKSCRLSKDLVKMENLHLQARSTPGEYREHTTASSVHLNQMAAGKAIRQAQLISVRSKPNIRTYVRTYIQDFST